MYKKLFASLPVVALLLAATSCSKDEIHLVTDLELKHVEILDPANRAAFCAGTGTLTVRLSGNEYYFDGGNKRKVRDFESAPSITREEYRNGKRYEPCGMFRMSFNTVDSIGQVYDAQNGSIDSECRIRLQRPITGPAGVVASAYVTHYRMSDANTFKGKFTISCP